MPAFYKIDMERRLVMSTATGVLTLADALAHQEELSKDPEFDPSFSQLMDATQITEVALEGEDVRKLAQRTIFSPESRRAILVKSDLAYGLGRMFEILRETRGEHGIRIFRNPDEALDWVLSEDERA
jgi:ATP phosphoribosyltransferase regulatory subunit HisZ